MISKSKKIKKSLDFLGVVLYNKFMEYLHNTHGGCDGSHQYCDSDHCYECGRTLVQKFDNDEFSEWDCPFNLLTLEERRWSIEQTAKWEAQNQGVPAYDHDDESVPF
jgi:hypothetical protein